MYKAACFRAREDVLHLVARLARRARSGSSPGIPVFFSASVRRPYLTLYPVLSLAFTASLCPVKRLLARPVLALGVRRPAVAWARASARGGRGYGWGWGGGGWLLICVSLGAALAARQQYLGPALRSACRTRLGRPSTAHYPARPLSALP
jgi:hypothetical protein